MPLPSLSVCREFSAERINLVVNHPDVRPWVGGDGPLDLSPVVADSNNYLLMGEGGGFLLVQQEPGIYEVHSQFLAGNRGEAVVQAAHDASRYMFTRTDCIEIRTKVPNGNVAAAALTRRMGWEFQFERANAWQTASGLTSVRYFAKTINQWANTAPGIADTGHWFHEKLEDAKIAAGSAMPIHDDDDAHDRYVGATCEMVMAGQFAKAMAFYHRWAPFAGYAPISVIATNPLVIDIGDALLAVRNDNYEVLLCR